nr:hypothetical protein SHINE37_41903 [Rhizobiaceae bacterium]
MRKPHCHQTVTHFNHCLTRGRPERPCTPLSRRFHCPARSGLAPDPEGAIGGSHPPASSAEARLASSPVRAGAGDGM